VRQQKAGHGHQSADKVHFDTNFTGAASSTFLQAEACPRRAAEMDIATMDTGASTLLECPSTPSSSTCSQAVAGQLEAATDSDTKDSGTGTRGEAPSAQRTTASVPTYRDRIVAIYMKHNPCKVLEVDRFLADYQGRELALYLKICTKYGVPSEPLL
jgi:hypothetical protein